MLQRPSLHPGKHAGINLLGIVRRAQDKTPARPAQCLVRRGRDELGVRDGGRMHSGGNQAGDVRHIHEQQRADFVAHGPERLEIDSARICRRPREYHLRPVLARQGAYLVEIELFRLADHLVSDDLVKQPREILGMPVRQMASGA